MANNKLCSGDTLLPGQSLTSPNGRYTLTLEPDGLLVLTDTVTGAILWSSPNMPQNSGVISCTVGTTGIVSIVDNGVILWSFGAPMRGGACLFIENDGNLVVVATATGQVTWQSGTAHAARMLVRLQAARTAVQVLQQEIESAERELFGLLAVRGYPRAATPFDAHEQASHVKRAGLEEKGHREKTG